jgi:histidinol-phosphate aminotransferase
VNRIAQAGALAALDDREFVERTLEITRSGREQLYAGFDKLGLRYYRSCTNFVLVDVGVPADPIFQTMIERGVIVRPMSSLGLPNCLRITIGLSHENRRTLETLERILAMIPVRAGDML